MLGKNVHFMDGIVLDVVYILQKLCVAYKQNLPWEVIVLPIWEVQFSNDFVNLIGDSG